MKLVEYLSKNCIEVGLAPANKKEVLRVISKIAKHNKLLAKISEEDIFQGFMNREMLGSTGFGNHIAIPHFTSDKIAEFVVGIATVPDGVDFQSLDNKPTHVFIFIIAPQSKRNQHLGVLSNIARFLRNPENVKSLMAAKSVDDLYSFVQSHHYTEEEIQTNFDNNLFTVIIQLEDRFEEILDVFNEIDDCHVSILEANNASKYLYNVPLFASLWTTEQKGFNRIIIGVVKKTSTNQALQRLNTIVESLENKTGVLILVQDLFYSSGTLEI